jgi:hypothetical protein
MHKIYFANRPHTREKNCPNLWPVADKFLYRTPRSVFAEEDFVVYINPKPPKGLTAPVAEITIYDARRVMFRQISANQENMCGGSILHLTYSNHYVHMGSGFELTRDSSENMEKYSRRCQALLIAQEAVDLFRAYFPDIQPSTQ